MRVAGALALHGVVATDAEHELAMALRNSMTLFDSSRWPDRANPCRSDDIVLRTMSGVTPHSRGKAIHRPFAPPAPWR